MKKKKTETEKQHRGRKKERSRKKGPFRTITMPTFTRPVQKLLLKQVKGDWDSEAELLDRILAKLWAKYAKTTAYNIVRSFRHVAQLLTDEPINSPRVVSIIKEAKAKAQTSYKKKAKVLTLQEVTKLRKSLRKNGLARLFTLTMCLSARCGDLEEATHIATDKRGWRCGLPTQKTRRTTGRTVAFIPWDFIRKMKGTALIKSLQPGQKLASQEEVIAFQKFFAGRRHCMRRTSITIRLMLGHKPDDIRQATLHTNNEQLFEYVGIPSMSKA